MKLKYKFKKLRIRLKKSLQTNHPINLNEVLIKKTITKLLSNEKNPIYIFPTPEIIYIQTEKKDYTIILGPNKIKITNHKLFIETYINETFSSELTHMVYKCLDKRKMKMDDLIFNNESDGLNYILNSLTN